MAAENNKGIDDRQRRRNFLLFSGGLGFVTLLVFMVIDYREGNTTEIFIDAFMCAVIVFGMLAVFKFNLDLVAYCVGINLMSLALLYDVSIGAGGTGGLFWLPVMPLFNFFFFEKPESMISTVVLCGFQPWHLPRMLRQVVWGSGMVRVEKKRIVQAINATCAYGGSNRPASPEMGSDIIRCGLLPGECNMPNS